MFVYNFHILVKSKVKTIFAFDYQVESHINDALTKGAVCLRGGKRHELGGNFFQPTILTEVTPDMIICKQETFGPVAPLIKQVIYHNRVFSLT